jgi:hypothetical protein
MGKKNRWRSGVFQGVCANQRFTPACGKHVQHVPRTRRECLVMSPHQLGLEGP